MKIKKIGNKVLLKRDENTLEVEIDQRVSTGRLMFIVLWFVVVFVAGIAIIPVYLKLSSEWTGIKIFYTVILIAWIYFLFTIGKILAWRYNGRELITFKGGNMSIANKYGNFGKPQVFDAKEVRQIKEYHAPDELLKKYIDYGFLGTRGESFEFLYKGKEYVMGKMLTEKEKRLLLPVLQRELLRQQK